MTFEKYLKLPFYVRWVMHDELGELIDRTSPEDDGGGGGIPGQLKQAPR